MAGTRSAAAPTRRRWSDWVLAAALVLGPLLGLSACRPAEPPVDRARAALAQGDVAGAVQTLQAHLQNAPRDGDGQLLLGQALMDLGDAGAAEAAFRQAQAAGVAETALAPWLAEAQLAQGKAADVVRDWRMAHLASPPADARLKASVATALLQQSDSGGARALLLSALTAVPDSVPAQLAQARLEARMGQLDAARQRLRAVLDNDGSLADAWLQLGQLSIGQGRPEQAADQMRQALQRQPRHVATHVALVGLLLAQRQIPQAADALKTMRSVLPRHPQTHMLSGQLAYLRGDWDAADAEFQALLRLSPQNPILLQSVASVALQRGQADRAEQQLALALARSPELASVRRLLAQAQMAQGQAVQALLTLAPLIDDEDALDPNALTLAAQARLATGDLQGAELLFDRAARLTPDDPKVRVAIALQHLSRGQPERTIAELSQLSASSTGVAADLALVSTLLRAREWEQALNAIAAIERKQPGRAATALLQGQVLLARADPAGARRGYEEALRRDADHLPALVALARLDLREGKLTDARARLQARVQAQPRDASAMLALADVLHRSAAAHGEVTELLQRAVQVNPLQPASHRALVDHHLQAHQAGAAATAAQAGLAQRPDDPELLLRLGLARFQQGAMRQATASYQRVLQGNDRSVPALVGLAEVLMAEGALDDALRTVQRALAVDPSSLRLSRMALTLALRQQRLDEARQLARGVQARHPQAAVGLVLEAEVELAERRVDAALTLLDAAVQRPEPGISPQWQHHVLKLAGRTAEASEMARRWVEAHPADALFLHYLGDLAQRDGDWPAAARHYRAVLAQQPRHGQALNNLAWVMLKMKQPGALAVAQRAAQAWPGSPMVMDTLSHALEAEGREEAALATAQEAVGLADERSPIQVSARLQLARLLTKAGRWSDARTALARLPDRAASAPRQAEVNALLKAISARQ